MGGIAAYLTAESVCVGDGIELETASSFSQPAGRLVPSQLIQLHFFPHSSATVYQTFTSVAVKCVFHPDVTLVVC